MVEADIGNDPVEPGMKRAIEPERMQVPEYFQKRFLINVPRFVRRAQKVHGQAEHASVILPHKPLEGVMVALLGRADQACFVSGLKPGVGKMALTVPAASYILVLLMP